MGKEQGSSEIPEIQDSKDSRFKIQDSRRVGSPEIPEIQLMCDARGL